MNLFSRRCVSYSAGLGNLSFNLDSKGLSYSTDLPTKWKSVSNADDKSMLLLIHSQFGLSDLSNDTILKTKFTIYSRNPSPYYSLWEVSLQEREHLQQYLFLRYGIFTAVVASGTVVPLILSAESINFGVISDYIRAYISTNDIISSEFIYTHLETDAQVNQLARVLLEVNMPLSMRLGFILESFYKCYENKYPRLSIDFKKLESTNQNTRRKQRKACKILGCFQETCPHPDTCCDRGITSPCIQCMSRKLLKEPLIREYIKIMTTSMTQKSDYIHLLDVIDKITEDDQIVHKLMYIGYRIRCTIFHFNVTQITPSCVEELLIQRLIAEIALILLHRSWITALSV